MYQVREAFIDPQVWLLVLFMLLNEVINGGIANFGKLIVKGVVRDPLQTVALGIPQGAFQVFYILSGTYLASRIKNCRTIIMIIYLLPTVLGTCLMWKLDRSESSKIGVLFSYYIVGAFVTSLVLAMQMPTTNLGGYTKRITASAMVFIAYVSYHLVKWKSRAHSSLVTVLATSSALTPSWAVRHLITRPAASPFWPVLSAKSWLPFVSDCS